MTPLGRAIELLRRGEAEQADEEFVKLENEEDKIEAKAVVRTAWIVNRRMSPDESINELTALKAKYRMRRRRSWLGFYHYRLSASIEHYKRCIEICPSGSNNYYRRMATVGLAKLQFRTTDRSSGLARLQVAVADSSRELRIQAISTWNELREVIKPTNHEELVVLCTGLQDATDSKELVRRLIELCITNNWKYLLAYFAIQPDHQDGESANRAGRAYAHLELFSLAYLSFARAAELGATVGIANIGSDGSKSPCARRRAKNPARSCWAHRFCRRGRSICTRGKLNVHAIRRREGQCLFTNRRSTVSRDGASSAGKCLGQLRLLTMASL